MLLSLPLLSTLFAIGIVVQDAVDFLYNSSKTLKRNILSDIYGLPPYLSTAHGVESEGHGDSGAATVAVERERERAPP